MPTNPVHFEAVPAEDTPEPFQWVEWGPESVPEISTNSSTYNAAAVSTYASNPIWANLQQDLDRINKMNDLEKAKMMFTQQNALSKKKVLPPQEKIPPEKLAILLAEAKQQISFYEVQVKQMEKEYQELYTKFRDIQLRMATCPDPEETHHAIQVYCKINKITTKIRKSRGMVQEFIGALEHKDVPIGDDELVD